MKHETTNTRSRILGTRLFCSLRSTERAAVGVLALPRAWEAIHTGPSGLAAAHPLTVDLALRDPVREGFSITGSEVGAVVEDPKDELGTLVRA